MLGPQAHTLLVPVWVMSLTDNDWESAVADIVGFIPPGVLWAKIGQGPMATVAVGPPIDDASSPAVLWGM